MYIIVAGGGLVGKGLAKTLAEAKHDVVVIDQKTEVCEDIYTTTGSITITGNATDIHVLENAGIHKADVAIGALGNDADNMAFSLLAKHHNVKQVCVRMTDSKYEAVYRSIGVENIARATELLIDQIIVSIESPELRKLIGFGDLELCIINVPEESQISGKSVLEFRDTKGVPQDINITCLYEGKTGELVLPNKDTRIMAGDRMFICGNRKNLKKTANILHKTKASVSV